MTSTGGATGDVQAQAEDLAHKAVELSSAAADVPREAASGILAAVSRTTHALAELVDKLASTLSG